MPLGLSRRTGVTARADPDARRNRARARPVPDQLFGSSSRSSNPRVAPRASKEGHGSRRAPSIPIITAASPGRACAARSGFGRGSPRFAATGAGRERTPRAGGPLLGPPTVTRRADLAVRQPGYRTAPDPAPKARRFAVYVIGDYVSVGSGSTPSPTTPHGAGHEGTPHRRTRPCAHVSRTRVTAAYNRSRPNHELDRLRGASHRDGVCHRAAVSADLCRTTGHRFGSAPQCLPDCRWA